MNKRLSFPLVCWSLVSLVILLAGCDEIQDRIAEMDSPSVPVDAGVLGSDSYRSDFFGFSIAFPAQWHTLSSGEVKELNEMTMQAMAAEAPDFHQEMQAAADGTYHLVGLFRDPIDSARGFNPNIMVTAEKLEEKEVRTGEDYLLRTREEVRKMGGPFTFGEEIRSGSFGGKEFYALSGNISVGGMRVNQFFYATVVDDYALCFVLSYGNSSQFSAMQRVLNSIEFE